MTENLNKGHRERLRNRYLQHGLQSLQDHEVLELLLFQSLPRKDTNKLAHELIAKFGSLNAVLEAPMEKLVQVKGVSVVTATNIALLKHLRERYDLCVAKSDPLDTLQDIYHHAEHEIGHSDTERLLVIFMDVNTKYLGEDLNFSVSKDMVAFDSKKIINKALELGASFVVLFHNHGNAPSTPSDSDLKSTTALFNALATLRISLFDHVIFSATTPPYGFRKEGRISEMAEKYKEFLGESK